MEKSVCSCSAVHDVCFSRSDTAKTDMIPPLSYVRRKNQRGQPHVEEINERVEAQLSH